MRSLSVLNCLIPVLALAATGCASPTGFPPDAVPTGEAAPQYQIGPGDALDVFVYLAPELSAANLPVRPDGRISLPLVPDLVAAGRSPSQLATEITTRLRRYVVDPNVTVMVRSFVGASAHQVRILGEANQPRTVPYREGMTVVDAILEARGMTKFAAGNRALIIRRGTSGEPPRSLVIRLDDLMRGGDLSQDVQLRPGDTIVIPQGWF